MLKMLKSELKKVVSMVSEENADAKTIVLESKYVVDRNNRMYERMREDLCRHE